MRNGYTSVTSRNDFNRLLRNSRFHTLTDNKVSVNSYLVLMDTPVSQIFMLLRARNRHV